MGGGQLLSTRATKHRAGTNPSGNDRAGNCTAGIDSGSANTKGVLEVRGFASGDRAVLLPLWDGRSWSAVIPKNPLKS